MKITITLEQLESFLKNLDKAKVSAYEESRQILKDTFENDIMRQSYDSVVQIENKDELRKLIKTGGSPRKGKPYNPNYLEQKRKAGEMYPHQFRDHSFLLNTKIDYDNDKVIMSTKQPTDQSKYGKFKKGAGDYLSYHETQRSVLKATFLKSWQKIIESIIKKYTEEAQK